MQLVLCGLSAAVYDTVRRSPLGEALGDGGLFFNLEMAVARYGATGNDGVRE